ncbi:glycosyltransferase family 2 protein [Desulfovibrio gilichinskyi]|uniref:Capsular biosynthesis protein n=1 Tax=Desulfovibrio gilichinskyi TaxID=1519643 RepID=A0A1X7CYW3_9BACT|nr:glycosyltransferase family 2 protein [Desulfovibrio gilichinskyi]SMF05608.1 hypothetical protein SAMN06295933_1446 [Desulfovibrio gilichinskyi]
MITIPMAGLSSRFKKAGYTKPKYMLEAGGKTLFELSVQSFNKYFDEIPFMFIMRDECNTFDFVKQQCKTLGIKKTIFHVLASPTRGQADTVRIGLETNGIVSDEPLTIFNIDSFIPGFSYPEWLDNCDGYLEVFHDDGEHWSFIKPDSRNADFVAYTAEKQRISDLCSNGLYHFSRCSDFLEAATHQSSTENKDLQGGEMYVAPLYNYLISSGRKIRYNIIPKDKMFFCGTPDEYDFFIQNSIEQYTQQSSGAEL